MKNTLCINNCPIIFRQESNKENIGPPPTFPSQSLESEMRSASPFKILENGTGTKETISLSETSTKVRLNCVHLHYKVFFKCIYVKFIGKNLCIYE